jgi:hypothetical protein
MELIAIVIAVVAAFVAYRLGHHSGERNGASQTNRELIRGATSELGDAQQNELAQRMGELTRRAPSSHLKNLGAFTARAFEMGKLLATANRDAGEAFQERMSAPKGDKVRIDLSMPQLHAIERLADFGFHQMLRPETRDPWRFRSREEAYEAAASIDSLSRLVGLESNEDASMRSLRMDGSGDRQAMIAFAFRTTPQE